MFYSTCGNLEIGSHIGFFQGGSQAKIKDYALRNHYAKKKSFLSNQ